MSPDARAVLTALQQRIADTSIHHASLRGLVEAFELAAAAIELTLDQAVDELAHELPCTSAGTTPNHAQNRVSA